MTNDAISRLLAKFRIIDDDANDFSLQTLWENPSLIKTAVNDKPIEHIFSHVCWNMFCHYSDVTLSPFVDLLDKPFFIMYGETQCECRWMTEQEMQKVGITSSVKKVMSAVKSYQPNIHTSGKRKRVT